jgi:hypothetical protein
MAELKDRQKRGQGDVSTENHVTAKKFETESCDK